ncbi:MAG TPA: hypothetical protein PLU22_25300, partial [Polyangiaceae bacterium]|nr:hypothetical protein [Polyangiaceae bacterium]
MSVGFESVLALTADGTVWGAGLLGPRGQRERNPPNPAAGFVRLGGGYSGVHAEDFDDYALDRAGRVYAFRDGAFTPVPGLDAGVRALAGDASLGCALLGDGALWCWGFGYHGALANGTLVNSERPGRATRLPPMAAVALGSDHGCGLARDGRLLCWGSDEDGAVGVDRRGILEPIEVRLGASTAPPPAPRYLAAPEATREVPTFAELPDPRSVPCVRSGPPLAAGAGELESVEGTLAGKGIEGELLRVGARVFTRWHDAAGDAPAFAGTVDEQGQATLTARSGDEPAPARVATITGQLAPTGTLEGTLARDGAARQRLELRVTAAIGAAGALTGYGALRGSEILDEPSEESPVGTLAHTWLEVLVDRRGPGAPRLRVAGWRAGTSHGACSPGLALVPAPGAFGEQNRGWERVLGARLAPHPIAGTYLSSVTCERAWSIEWLSVFTEEPP